MFEHSSIFLFLILFLLLSGPTDSVSEVTNPLALRRLSFITGLFGRTALKGADDIIGKGAAKGADDVIGKGATKGVDDIAGKGAANFAKGGLKSSVKFGRFFSPKALGKAFLQNGAFSKKVKDIFLKLAKPKLDIIQKKLGKSASAKAAQQSSAVAVKESARQQRITWQMLARNPSLITGTGKTGGKTIKSGATAAAPKTAEAAKKSVLKNMVGKSKEKLRKVLDAMGGKIAKRASESALKYLGGFMTKRVAIMLGGGAAANVAVEGAVQTHKQQKDKTKEKNKREDEDKEFTGDKKNDLDKYSKPRKANEGEDFRDEEELHVESRRKHPRKSREPSDEIDQFESDTIPSGRHSTPSGRI